MDDTDYSIEDIVRSNIEVDEEPNEIFDDAENDRLRRSDRVRNPPMRYGDIVTH